MTIKIAKSALPEGFEVAVAAHAFEMRHWRAHMARVEQDRKNDVPAAERHVGFPRPQSHPLVDSAVNENDIADYEIVDDGPMPAQILAAKKTNLMHQVSLAEAAVIAAIMPLGKRRLFNLRENDIRNADTALAATLMPGRIASAASAIGIAKPIDIVAETEKRRSADDTKFLQEQAERRLHIAAIERIAAQAHHDIEDLTLDTIDAWKMPDFSK